MKNQNQSKTIRMIAKFDKQLCDILKEELAQAREVKNLFIAQLTNNTDALRVA